jgi:Ion channel
VRLFERPYYEDDADNGAWDPIPDTDSDYQDYNYAWNGMWLVVVTMTSGNLNSPYTYTLVGFGDYYPRSHFGRFLIIITTFWGVFLVAMCIVSVSNYRQFYSTEKYVSVKYTNTYTHKRYYYFRHSRSYKG